MELSFRRITTNDLPRLFHWLGQPHVREWYSPREPSYPDVVAKYGPRTSPDSPVRAFIVVIDGVEVGYIQTYFLASFPDYAALVGTSGDVAGVDLFLGEASMVRRGFGGPVIRHFVDEVVFGRDRAIACIAGPSARNRASIRAFEKAGFRTWKIVSSPDGEPEQLLRIERIEEGKCTPSDTCTSA